MNGTETKQTSSNKGKSVRKERKREEYEERTFAAFIGRFTRRNSRFHGGERKRFIGSVRTRKVSQPTNELLVPSWMNDRQREREGGGGGRRTFLKRGNSSIGERGYLFFAMGRGGEGDHPPIF